MDTASNCHPDAIRERLRIVCDTFSAATCAFPEPMTPEERQEILALTDEQLEDAELLARLGLRWGVDLNWLFLGRIDGLLIRSTWKAVASKFKDAGYDTCTLLMSPRKIGDPRTPLCEHR